MIVSIIFFNNFHLVENGHYFTHTFSIIITEELKEKNKLLKKIIKKIFGANCSKGQLFWHNFMVNAKKLTRSVRGTALVGYKYEIYRTNITLQMNILRLWPD